MSKELSWVEDEAQKQTLVPFTGTKATELLTCDDVPYLAYLEYTDAAAAKEELAPRCCPTSHPRTPLSAAGDGHTAGTTAIPVSLIATRLHTS